jgi:hypothetical protein
MTYVGPQRHRKKSNIYIYNILYITRERRNNIAININSEAVQNKNVA